MSREARRRGSRRARRREAVETVTRILQLSEQGLSTNAVASSVGVSEQHVGRTLFLLGKVDQGPEATEEEGGRR